MIRQSLIILSIVLASVAAFVAIIGVCWLTLHIVHGVFPTLLASRLQTMAGVLPVLCIAVAFVAAGCAASALADRKKTAKAAPAQRANGPGMHS